MKTTPRHNLLAIAIICALSLAPTLFAQDAPAAAAKTAEPKSDAKLEAAAAPNADPWHFCLTPLVWVAGINGSVTVHGNKADLNVGFDNLLDHLNGGLMLYLELRKNKFGFYAQPNYMNLSGDGNAGPLSARNTMHFWIVEAGGFYQLAKWGEEKPLTLDAIAGVQYWNLDNELTLKDSGGVITFKGSDTMSLIDPIIGMRAVKYLTPKLSLNLQGDVGGFGISSKSSDLSWQAVGMLGYDFTKHFSLFAGYRALSVRKDSGSGAGQEGVDLILNGAILGLQFHW